MICNWCAHCADKEFAGWTHNTPNGGYLYEGCKGGTHCDCQHKEPGTAINKEVTSDSQPD